MHFTAYGRNNVGADRHVKIVTGIFFTSFDLEGFIRSVYSRARNKFFPGRRILFLSVFRMGKKFG